MLKIKHLAIFLFLFSRDFPVNRQKMGRTTPYCTLKIQSDDIVRKECNRCPLL